MAEQKISYVSDMDEKEMDMKNLEEIAGGTVTVAVHDLGVARVFGEAPSDILAVAGKRKAIEKARVIAVAEGKNQVQVLAKSAGLTVC